jgi:hypothetical protein
LCVLVKAKYRPHNSDNETCTGLTYAHRCASEFRKTSNFSASRLFALPSAYQIRPRR